jgi:hypothetical protein
MPNIHAPSGSRFYSLAVTPRRLLAAPKPINVDLSRHLVVAGDFQVRAQVARRVVLQHLRRGGGVLWLDAACDEASAGFCRSAADATSEVTNYYQLEPSWPLMLEDGSLPPGVSAGPGCLGPRGARPSSESWCFWCFRAAHRPSRCHDARDRARRLPHLRRPAHHGQTASLAGLPADHALGALTGHSAAPGL